MLNAMVKNLNTTKSDLIKKSVIHYKSVVEKEQLKQQIKAASFKVRAESLRTVKEFEESIEDGLTNI
jgi:hypothetical protein